jgi:putative sigma-54 modulation protein
MITGRHVAVTPALREYVEMRMERLDRYGLKLGTLQILLSLEKFHHVAEVVGVVQGRRLQAKTSTEEMYASIDDMVDKLGAQLRKLKERRANHKFGDQPRTRAVVRRFPTQVQSGLEELAEGTTARKPVRSRFGWHILRLHRRIEGRTLPFEMARERIADMLEARSWSVEAARYATQLAARNEVEGVLIEATA